MTVYDYLRDHALKNVWCTPNQDTQVILKLAKINGPGGVKKKAKVLWRDVYLPDATSSWNVYQIGQAHPLILGLFPMSHEWVTMEETCNRQKMIADIYTSEGINLPRFQTYYKYNEDRNLIVAVKKNPTIPFDFNKDDIFLRVYSNEFFNTQRADAVNDFISVHGQIPIDTSEILALQTMYTTLASKVGATNVFVNGFKKDTVDLLTVVPGDVVEIVYDSSVYKVIDFKVGDLLNFHSTMDFKMKYLLHYSGADNGVIDYQDDIDVFILRPMTGGRHQGLFYHKNNADSMRNLTHRDYSIVVPYVVNYNNVFAKNNPTIPVLDPDELYVRLHIRKSGYDRPLVFENSRIHELYKMEDIDIVKAMLGIESTVGVWRADALEASGYSEIMRSDCNDVTNQLVTKGYGYNAISKIIGETPSATYDYSNKKAIDVPYGLQNGSTAYEYDSNGDFIGWYLHPIGSRYICFNNTAAYVEIIGGTGGEYLDEYYNPTNVGANPKHSFRVYECKTISGVPNNKFVDITDNDAKYTLANGRFIWNDGNPANYPVLRSNSRFLAKDYQLPASNGEIRFSLTSLQKRGPVWTEWVMQIPLGNLDVFLNGKSLIRNLDYVINFPEIVIINKNYLVNPAVDLQNIHVRFAGFCKTDFSYDDDGDYGFIVHGVLSDNNRYDIRDDKVLRITVNGSLKTRADLTFSEFHPGVSVVNPLNGAPYQVKDIVVPFRGMASDDTYIARHKSIDIDKAVADYLTVKIPEPDRPATTAIATRYPVVSPFCNKIIFEIDNGGLVIEDKIYKDQEVYELCKGYENLLKYDPTTPALQVDDRFVIIHPHGLGFVVQMSLTQYRFMEQVVRLYAKNKVVLSPFVVMV